MIPESVTQDPVAAAVIAQFPDAVVDAKKDLGELTLVIASERLVEVCKFLKLSEKFVRLSSVTAVDWHPSEPRFEVVYHLHSIERNLRLRLKVRVSGENPSVDSVYGVWRGCDWYERETFDLFGITFKGHPNLIRIMMPENWQGHPLRKDYPAHGYKYSYVDEQ